MKILLDGDMLLFAATSATEVEVQLDEDVWTRHSELPEARAYYWDQLASWVEFYGCGLDDVVHCFTDASAFRRELFPEYKLSRKGKPKPIGYKALRSELLCEDLAFMYSQIEADDLIGILATQMLESGEEYVIASGDKDLLQIPGRHIWMPTSKDPEPEDGLTIDYAVDSIIKTTTQEYSLRYTYRQYLQGDATDGIPGCPGIGEVKARGIAAGLDLSRPVDCWEEIVRTFEEAQRKKKLDLYNASEYATLQARLVRILRRDEYCFDTHKVTLWNPPTR